MKTIFTLFLALVLATSAFSQQFEESVKANEEADRPRVRIGADFAMQLQALEHHADTARLIPLGKGITLPAANFSIDATLADGIEVNLTTYLSSRHHNESWVKGGYLLIDKLPFLENQTITNIMDYLTFKAGVMELNYGDAHFRRTDNGNSIRNPFVGNLIIDAFTTTPALEILFRSNGILLMGGLTAGTANPSLVGYNAATKQYTAYDQGKELAFYGKVGYDKQISDDFRFRATVSGYHSAKNHAGSLYNGDRAGSRFFLVMQRATNNAADVDIKANPGVGGWGPGTTNKDNSVMGNIFTKFKGLEFFGTIEGLKGTLVNGSSFKMGQYAVEGVYRFGGDEQFFGGVRYNEAWDSNDSKVNRLEAGIGWFPLKSIIIKAEYIDQNYKNFAVYGGGAGFNGFMIESAISF